MPSRRSNWKLLRISAVRLAFPLCLTLTLVEAGFAEPGIVRTNPPSASSEDSRRSPTEAKPFIVERRQIGDGPKTDPWLRFELRFGEPREKCRTWRFETRGQADGHAVFDLNEPFDESVISVSQFGSQHIELVLGDAECSYRIRIERSK